MNLYLDVEVFADEQVERCRREGGAYFVEGTKRSREANASEVEMEVEEEFEDVAYDDEEEEEEEEDDEQEHSVEEDWWNEGPAGEERNVKSWEGEDKLVVQGTDLAFVIENHREFSVP